MTDTDRAARDPAREAAVFTAALDDLMAVESAYVEIDGHVVAEYRQHAEDVWEFRGAGDHIWRLPMQQRVEVDAFGETTALTTDGKKVDVSVRVSRPVCEADLVPEPDAHPSSRFAVRPR